MEEWTFNVKSKNVCLKE